MDIFANKAIKCPAAPPTIASIASKAVSTGSEVGCPLFDPTAVIAHFYKTLLEHEPSLKTLFNATHLADGTQASAFAHTITTFATNPAALPAAISRIAEKHASLGVSANHYHILGDYLIRSMKNGNGTGGDVLDTWMKAYNSLAEKFTDIESRLYEEAVGREGGWVGCRPFVVARVVPESEVITSLYLKPLHPHPKGHLLPLYKPGQYITVRTFAPSLNIDQPRQFTLSDIPGDRSEFRISVKREYASDRGPAGVISNMLHGTLAENLELYVSMPFGDFVLDVEKKTPVVLISAGVGITPMMAMLKAIVSQPDNPRSVAFIHAARNKRVHAMGPALSQIITSNSSSHKISRAIWYGQVNPATDIQGVDYDFEGRVNLKQVRGMVLFPEADYYICGPKGFMDCQRRALVEMGVKWERIQVEFFGVMCDNVIQTGLGYVGAGDVRHLGC
ncbi:MAG: hypothetical protein M1839_002976 [Geoglossum umbratile]|nr:MAG: hypothetical protein M1839_002976 [Geoglossum umbratile]